MSAAHRGTATASTTESPGSIAIAMIEAAHGEDGRLGEYPHDPVHERLHLRHVIRLPCDEGGRVETIQLLEGIGSDAVEEVGTKLRAEAVGNDAGNDVSAGGRLPPRPPAMESMSSPSRRTIPMSRAATPLSTIRAMMVGCSRSLTDSTERHARAARKGQRYFRM